MGKNENGFDVSELEERINNFLTEYSELYSDFKRIQEAEKPDENLLNAERLIEDANTQIKDIRTARREERKYFISDKNPDFDTNTIFEEIINKKLRDNLTQLGFDGQTLEEQKDKITEQRKNYEDNCRKTEKPLQKEAEKILNEFFAFIDSSFESMKITYHAISERAELIVEDEKIATAVGIGLESLYKIIDKLSEICGYTEYLLNSHSFFDQEYVSKIQDILEEIEKMKEATSEHDIEEAIDAFIKNHVSFREVKVVEDFFEFLAKSKSSEAELGAQS